MMAGQATLEYGYNAAVWAASYVKSAAIATYNAGKYAYTVSSNAAKYYGSTAIINGVKGYDRVKTMAGFGYMTIDKSIVLSIIAGIADGFVKYYYEFPPDSPYLLSNHYFQIVPDVVNYFISTILK